MESWANTPSQECVTPTSCPPLSQLTLCVQPWKGGQPEVELLDYGQWLEFHNIGTEMIVTRNGRRMFPVLRYKIKNLDPHAFYNLLVSMQLVDGCHWKFTDGCWSKGETGEGFLEANSGQIYLHPQSPSTGQHWMDATVSFEKLKISNCPEKFEMNFGRDLFGQLLLNTMHKYNPVLLIARVGDDGLTEGHIPVFRYEVPVTQFIAVPSYQSSEITQLKIDRNPFAKGFRDDQKQNIARVAQPESTKRSRFRLIGNNRHKPHTKLGNSRKEGKPTRLPDPIQNPVAFGDSCNQMFRNSSYTSENWQATQDPRSNHINTQVTFHPENCKSVFSYPPPPTMYTKTVNTFADHPMNLKSANNFADHPMDTNPVNTFCYHPMDTKPVNTFADHSLYIKPVNTFADHPMDTNPVNTFCYHPVGTKPVNTFSEHPMDTKPVNTFLYHPIANPVNTFADHPMYIKPANTFADHSIYTKPMHTFAGQPVDKSSHSYPQAPLDTKSILGCHQPPIMPAFHISPGGFPPITYQHLNGDQNSGHGPSSLTGVAGVVHNQLNNDWRVTANGISAPMPTICFPYSMGNTGDDARNQLLVNQFLSQMNHSVAIPVTFTLAPQYGSVQPPAEAAANIVWQGASAAEGRNQATEDQTNTHPQSNNSSQECEQMLLKSIKRDVGDIDDDDSNMLEVWNDKDSAVGASVCAPSWPNREGLKTDTPLVESQSETGIIIASAYSLCHSAHGQWNENAEAMDWEVGEKDENRDFYGKQPAHDLYNFAKQLGECNAYEDKSVFHEQPIESRKRSGSPNGYPASKKFSADSPKQKHDLNNCIPETDFGEPYVSRNNEFLHSSPRKNHNGGSCALEQSQLSPIRCPDSLFSVNGYST